MSIQAYLNAINTHYHTGLSTEHTYRADLQQLLSNILPKFLITNEPKRIACGMPDYLVSLNGIPKGHIEAKDIGVDLSSKSLHDQFDRYRKGLDNLVFTNYTDFHFYKFGVLFAKISIARIEQGSVIGLPENYEEFIQLIKDFSTVPAQTIKSPVKLAELMAGKARLMAIVIEKSLDNDDDNEVISDLKKQMLSFKQLLIHDITNSAFADIYAQTIAYGMFAARYHDPTLKTFSRIEAATLIPKSNPFLRKLFQDIAGFDLHTGITLMVDELVNIFLATDVADIMDNFGRSTRQDDPVVHFYETFLAIYNPSLRKARGVWYTPQPVVNFIVRGVDELLKKGFGITNGLVDTKKIKIKKDVLRFDERSKGKSKIIGTRAVEEEVHRVQILDPATGTGTFLAEIVRYIHGNFKGQQGIWSEYVTKHLIPRLNGFELLMASYAMAHLKLDMLLAETGYKPTSNQRFRIFLTNSLEDSHPDTGTLMGSLLSEEASLANALKKDIPIQVIIGNPPYNGESSNKSDWIMKLMENYKREPGGKEKLKEKNPKWINDDYVKFIRLGQYLVEKEGSGIMAFINPHGFLDNPTFRGMRWSLLNTFDKIYTIDLHGNSKKKEVAPDGSADVNVFDIMQGVSINFFIKKGAKKVGELGQLFHLDIYGKRELKYQTLLANNLLNLAFKEVKCTAPNYLMVPKDLVQEKQYYDGYGLHELFPSTSVGIVTARDGFTIQNSKSEMESTLKAFLAMDDEQARLKFDLGEDVRDWKISYARKDILNNYSEEKIVPINYRPFDQKWTFYTGNSKGFHCYPRNEIMKHFFRENVGLIFKLGNSEENSAPIFITKFISDFRSWSRPGMQGGDYVAPLYTYPKETNQISFDQVPYKTANLNPEIVKAIADGLDIPYFSEEIISEDRRGDQFCALDLFDYIYAVLHSPSYREKYKEFLKIDFPRIPYPKDPKKFFKLVDVGSKLRKIHLLESEEVENFSTQFPEPGDGYVDRPNFKLNEDGLTGKVYINDYQYIDKVPKLAWEFFIGGYQPAQKWLKDRKGKNLSYEDTLHYQRIIAALTRTSQIMLEIDKLLDI